MTKLQQTAGGGILVREEVQNEVVVPILPPSTKLHLEEAEEITYNEYTGELRLKRPRSFVWERYE